MSKNLEVALVTGAARGIGKATVEKFLQEGLRVVATDIVPEIEFWNSRDAMPLSHDVSKPSHGLPSLGMLKADLED